MGISKIDAGRVIRQYRESIKTKLLFPGMDLGMIDKEIAFLEDISKRGEGYQIKFNAYDEVQRYVRAVGMLEYYIKKFPKKIPGVYTFEKLEEDFKLCKTKLYNGYFSQDFVYDAERKVRGALKVMPAPLRNGTTEVLLRSLYDYKKEYTIFLSSALSKTEEIITKFREENKDKGPKLMKNLYIELHPYKTSFTDQELRAVGIIMHEAQVMRAPKAEDTIKESDLTNFLSKTVINIIPALGTDPDQKKLKERREEAEAKANAYREMLDEKQPTDPDQISAQILETMFPKFERNPDATLNQLQQADQVAKQLQELTQARNQILTK